MTLDPRYSAICGYTDTDLDTVFAPELPGLDRDRIRHWYNGYSWRGGEKVYNPFDILLLFDTREFKAHWFETGTPRFLIDTLLRRGVASPELDRMSGTDALLSAFDVDEMATEALLFQTGYLTIASEEDFDGETVYRLEYPNREVRQSLNGSLLRAMTPDRLAPGKGPRSPAPAPPGERLRGAGTPCSGRSSPAFPTSGTRKNDIARYEGYYASVFYSWFASAGLDVRVEEAPATVVWTWRCYSTGRSGCSSSRRWRRRRRGRAGADQGEGYADKYRHLGQPIYLIGVEFSRKERNVAAFAVERT